ncbi:hypothetical protein AB1Y20_004604 [Prymnesium parvum]|uniref:P53 and DNA damage-regulated protein 1 n=1 Tax=Prymnesium parvum TaxID=97485 RepID=A0AB34IZR5_PRYPA
MYAKWDNFKDSSSESDAGEEEEDESEDAVDVDEVQPAESRAATTATLIERIVRAELVGEEILVDRRQVVELDRKRNQNREALAALRRTARQDVGPQQAAATSAAQTTKRWVCMGDYFIRQPQFKVVEALQADQERIEAEIETLNQRIKQKTSELCALDPSIASGSNIHSAFAKLRGLSPSEIESVIGMTGAGMKTA